jgi:hypothetical protein
MKLHLKRMPGLTFNAASVVRTLAVMALTISAAFLGAAPVRAQTANPVTLQCQVGSNSNGQTLACSGTIPGGNIALSCQTPNAISDNGGVYTIASAACSGNDSVAGIDIGRTLSATTLTLDSNNGTITVLQGAGTLSISNGLSSVEVTCSGAFLSQTLSPLALNIPVGTCTVTPSVLGIGTAKISISSGSISLADPPAAILTINSPSIAASASVLNLLNFSTTCGTSVTLNLNQLFPITIPAPCSGL